MLRVDRDGPVTHTEIRHTIVKKDLQARLKITKKQLKDSMVSLNDRRFDMKKANNENIPAKELLEYAVYFATMCFSIYAIFAALKTL